MTSFGSTGPTYVTSGSDFGSGAGAPRYVSHSGAIGRPLDPIAGFALALSIISLAIPVLPAIVAFFLASAANRSIRASEGARRGEGVVLAARLCAGISLAIHALIALLVLIVAA